MTKFLAAVALAAGVASATAAAAHGGVFGTPGFVGFRTPFAGFGTPGFAGRVWPPCPAPVYSYPPVYYYPPVSYSPPAAYYYPYQYPYAPACGTYQCRPRVRGYTFPGRR